MNLQRRDRQRGRRRLITLALLLAAVALVILLGLRSGLLRPVVNIILTPLTPVARLLNISTEAISDLPAGQENYDALLAENLEYERTIAELQVEIVRLREIERDYYRVAELADYQAQHPDQNIVSADVVARDTSSYLRWLIINRGTRDGIQVGNPVITDLGLVGRVERATANEAWVRLIIDQASAVNGRLQNARAEGTVIGQLQGGLRMQFIPQSAAVEPGDVVLTSGLGGTFPANIVIGTVSSVQKQQAELFQQAEISPTVDFTDLSIVAVITTFEPVDTSTFDETIEEEGASP